MHVCPQDKKIDLFRNDLYSIAPCVKKIDLKK